MRTSDFPCPHCGSRVGAVCTSATGRALWGKPHKVRFAVLDQHVKVTDALATTFLVEGINGPVSYTTMFQIGNYLVALNRPGSCRGAYYRVVNKTTGYETSLYDMLAQAIEVAHAAHAGNLKGSFF